MRDPGVDKQAYERWVEQWAADLYRFAYRLCGRGHTAEDLVQETFYHAWRSKHTLREAGRARAWLFQILRHRYSHHVRSDARRVNLGTPIESVGEPRDHRATDTLERLARNESLQNALDTLEERYRLPLLLVFLEGMTCREAAEELGVPLGTVLSRIHRARKALRGRLEAPGDDGHAKGGGTGAPDLRLRMGG